MPKLVAFVYPIMVVFACFSSVLCGRHGRGHIIIIGGGGNQEPSVETKYVPIPVPMPCRHHPMAHHSPMFLRMPAPQIAYQRVPVFMPIPHMQKVPVFVKESDNHYERQQQTNYDQTDHSYDDHRNGREHSGAGLANQRYGPYGSATQNHDQRETRKISRFLFWRNGGSKQ